MVNLKWKGTPKYVKRFGFWSAVVAVVTAFTVVYLIFRVKYALTEDPDAKS